MCYGSFPTRKASISTVESYVVPKFTRGDLLAFGGFFIYDLSKLFEILNKFIKCSFVLFKMAGFQIYLQLRAMLSQSLRGEIYWHLAFGGFFISIFSRHHQKGKKDEWKIPHCSHCALLQLPLFSSILFSQKHSSIPQSLQYHFQSFILDFFKDKNLNL